MLVIDPEGEHVPLGALRGVTVLAGAQLPDPAELPAFYDQAVRGVVLDPVLGRSECPRTLPA